jgi:hypothetical protein
MISDQMVGRCRENYLQLWQLLQNPTSLVEQQHLDWIDDLVLSTSALIVQMVQDSPNCFSDVEVCCDPDATSMPAIDPVVTTVTPDTPSQNEDFCGLLTSEHSGAGFR